MNRKAFLYWVTATLFSILMGEILGPLLAGRSLPLLQYPLAFFIYYGILSAIFAVLVARSVHLSLVIMFAYGIAAELLLFGNISSITDLLGMLFFGTFYVFLFGAPVWIAKKLSARLPADKTM